MAAHPPRHDAVIIGGGFYGAAIAVYLAAQRGFRHMLLVEREPALMLRASYNNQARVHNGYHYPRSYTTAYRSRVNLPRFVRDWPQAVRQDFTKLYAIARHNSKLTARQFERFCRDIGAPVQQAPANLRELFQTRLIEDVFAVQEYAFDSTRLAEWALRELDRFAVQVHYRTCALAIDKVPEGLRVHLENERGEKTHVESRYVFNCSYSGTNQLGGDFPGVASPLKQEITEMALMAMPPALAGLGITVMDGPFFSLMPFPARGLHTLSHVRFTPHLNWQDRPGLDPYRKLRDYERVSRVERMVRDVARYIPAVADARHVDSLYEVKTVLQRNEDDDGRPILFERHATLPGCFSVLGGKIDNLYDVLEKLDDEAL